MYGMVNQGIQTFIVEKFGQDDWRDICSKADLSHDTFETMLTYPDDVTYRLVDVISKKYGMTSGEVLKVFGDYWVDYSASTRLGTVLRFGGRDVVQRLESLNEMHERIQSTMPHLRPPSFEFEEGDGGEHKLHYASEREGLEDMVIGLVEGLGRDSGQRVQITKDPAPMYPCYRATFTVRID